jgi:hypothetical protein
VHAGRAEVLARAEGLVGVWEEHLKPIRAARTVR